MNWGMLFYMLIQNLCFFKGTLFSESKYEKQANCFAAELLIPDSIIYDNPDLKKSQLAVLTGYTEKLLDYKRL